MTTDVLIFAEDPGAANFLSPLLKPLEDCGLASCVIAGPSADRFFAGASAPVERLDAEFRPAHFLRTARPKVILVGTSENVDSKAFELIQRAKASGTPTIGVVDAAMNAGFRFRGRSEDPLAYAPDFLIVPDGETALEYAAVGFERARTRVFEHPQFDRHRLLAASLAKNIGPLRQRLFPTWVSGRFIVVFASELSTSIDPAVYPDDDYSLWGRGGTRKRTMVALEELLDALQEITPKPYLVLRLHPKDRRDDYQEYLPEIDHVSEGGVPAEVVCAADLTVGLTTTLLAEAAVMGRPTLSILSRRQERRWLPRIPTGEIAAVSTRDELRSRLRTLVSDAAGIRNVNSLSVSHASRGIAQFVSEVIRSHGTMVG